MKKSLTLFSFLVLIFTVQLTAQVKFVVLSIKGKVEVSAGKSGKWSPVTVGQKLGKNDVVRTSFASYAKLMVNKERIVSIDENRTSALSQFAAQKGGSQGTSATGQLLGYVSEQVTRTKDKKAGEVYGAVRGGEEVFSAVFPKMNMMNEAPMFTWVDMTEGQKYQLTIMDKTFQKVFTKEVQGMTFELKEASPLLESGKVYYWQIMRISDSQASEVQQFRLLAKDTVAVLQAELASLGKELTAMGADEVTTHLIRAIYFERRNLAFDAYQEYRTVIKLAPDVAEYRNMLRNLLISLKFYNELDMLM